jgi:hypothetical protein
MSEYETSSQGVRDCYSLNAETHAVSPERGERFDRWLASVKADVWDEGALWSAIECGAISNEHNDFLAPGDNPYRGAEA